ncbi:hypothetical protein SAMN04488104_101214 [Algoriphagus faecimaris]|uniref:Outer membrane protein beta-barrel domain-containing protein n=1 Tax=Algoriphagus faecimaris TaxID=686796 RepID=A0A1G6RBA9_9BACT|nr:hypothetical protein [Algoriphagus faecimaris]SDD01375.1 hypothetical protein SAMN04488104_101214 [Algoriphagus faecimaris]
MKRFSLILFILVFASQWVMAQEKKVVKTNEFKLLGLNWYTEKYEDGTKSWAFTSPDEPKPEFTPKSTKYYSNLETDLGINIWAPSDNIPRVKPWGSWNVGLNYTGTYRASQNFHLKTGLGVSWYNFKLEDRNTFIDRTPDGLEFTQFTDGIGTKSKISASFANLTLVPTFLTNDGNVRIGVGGFAGLRIGGRGKFVYDNPEGNKEKLFTKSNMYVNNFRYGLRAEIGVGELDLYFNYDANSLFETGKGPDVNAFSFGLIFK